MKEFIDKLIERLEEESNNAEAEMHILADSEYSLPCQFDRIDIEDCKSKTFCEAIQIVSQLAEEYKDKVIIDGQYCWQTCGATEHCKECNRLCNGSIDYFENYDVLAEEYKVSEMPTGWIPCKRELPKAGTHRDVWISIENEVVSYKAKWYLDHFEWDNGWVIKENILAWMPNDVPAPYTEGE